MTDNEQKDPTPQLTRRQLRELRNTASTPIITGDTAESDAGAAPVPQPSAPLPRPAEPVVVSAPAAPEASIDLGARALTRRQARQQERIRTASVPIIAPDVHPSGGGDAHEPTAPDRDPAGAGEADAIGVEEGTPADDTTGAADEAEAGTAGESESAADAVVAAGEESEPVPEPEPEPERHVVSEELGAALLTGSADEAELPSSFDQLLSRSAAATGAFTAPNALILTQTPEAGPLVAPVTATGEVLITGTFALPDRFGSTGVVPGVADGSEADAVLVDGELPASSSPTPIAASSAISTIKSAEDVIRPPAPEKGGRTMMFLAITAGVLAAALAGVLVVALFTGVFSS